MTHDVSQTHDEQQNPSEQPSSPDSQPSILDKLSCSSPSVSQGSSSSSSSSSSSECESDVGVKICVSIPTPIITNKLVGDNLDKNIKARDVRADYQGRSLHFFQMYAVKDRVDLSDLPDNGIKYPDISTISMKDVLPTSADQNALYTNFSKLIARVLIKRMPFFKKFGKGVACHIKHEKYVEMSQKSEVVSTHNNHYA